MCRLFSYRFDEKYDPFEEPMNLKQKGYLETYIRILIFCGTEQM